MRVGQKVVTADTQDCTASVASLHAVAVLSKATTLLTAMLLCMQYVEKMKVEVLENLRHLGHAPGVQFAEVPPDSMLPDYEDVPDIPEGVGGGYMERIGRWVLGCIWCSFQRIGA